jgi:DNA repair protein SbcC/Rad50
MQLERLQMRNFKRYRSADVKFGDGITGIVGNNGTGKSTLVDAILFCLYGVKETGLDPSHIRSASAGPRDRAEVRLDFSVRGEKYQLLRTLGPGKRHETQFNQGGKLLAKGVSEVREALRRVIRMDHGDFRRTIFSSQKELLILVGATAGERREWFRKVLGIDALRNKGGEMLRAEAEAARERRSQIEGRLRGVDADGIRKSLRNIGEAIADSDLEVRRLGEEEQGIARARVSLQEEARIQRDREKKDHGIRSLIRAKEDEATDLERDLGKIRTALATLEVNRAEFENLQAAENDFPVHQEQYNESLGKHRTFTELTAREAEKKERIAEMGEELTRLRNEDARLARDEEKIRALAPLVARRQEISDRLTGFRRLEAHYRNLAAGIERKEATLEALAKQGESLRSRIERMKEEQGRLISLARRAGVPPDHERDPVPFLDGRRREILQAIADGKAARDHAARRLSELEANLSTLAAEGAGGACPTCRQPLGERYADLVADIRGDIRVLQDAKARQESDLRQAETDLDVLQSILRDAQRLRDACRNLEEDSAEWVGVQDEALREISAKEQLKQEMESLGYDPGAREELEKEYATLEDSWKESLAATERLKGRAEVHRKIRDLGGSLEKIRTEVTGITRERDNLRFDPDFHRRIEKVYSTAERAHRSYLELKPKMDQVPVLLGQEKDLEARAASLEHILIDLRAELTTVAFSLEELRQVESRLEENSRQAQEQGRRLERARAGKISLEREKVHLHEALDRVAEDTREHERLSGEIQLLELTREELNGFTDHLLGVVRGQIQEETGRILSEITDGRYDTVILDDAFELLVHDLGGDYPVSRFSGGEQDDVAIALRIALSRYIAETHELHDSTFLIFDEIFGSQDEERRGNIFRALRALEPFFPQIFLISHVTEVQGEFGNTLVVEAVSGTESRVRDLEGVEA